jgi:hypothetical protein
MVKQTTSSKQFEKTPQQRLTSQIVKQSFETNSRASGTTTQLRYGYATLYSVYKFKYKKFGKYFVSRDYVGTATTSRGQNAVNNYPELIRGAYLNAVYQFREENNVGSKGFSAIHLGSKFKYWEQNTVPSGSRITEADVIQHNPEKISFIINKEEYTSREEKKSRTEYAKTIVTSKNKKQKNKLAIEQAGYVRVKKKSGKRTKKTIQHKTKRHKK